MFREGPLLAARELYRLIPVANIERTEDPKLHCRSIDGTTVHSGCITAPTLLSRYRSLDDS